MPQPADLRCLSRKLVRVGSRGVQLDDPGVVGVGGGWAVKRDSAPRARCRSESAIRAQLTMALATTTIRECSFAVCPPMSRGATVASCPVSTACTTATSGETLRERRGWDFGEAQVSIDTTSAWQREVFSRKIC